MNVTSKSRYALKIMMDLAESASVVTHRSDIAGRQGIPLDYMDQILSRLRDAALIESTRGRTGGYRLSQDPHEVSVLEIFTAVEDAFQPVQCLDGGTGCMSAGVCGSKDAWGVISDAIRHSLSGIILSDLVAHKPHGLTGELSNQTGVTMHECRAPKRRAGGKVL